ncbi:copper resistance protein B [Pseudomonas aeruginosa]|nr:copper resistance protein B [Pseudomonas aeruginosa]
MSRQTKPARLAGGALALGLLLGLPTLVEAAQDGGMDHSGMNHGAMPGMDHGSPPSTAPSTTKPAGHQGMDHSGMNHGAMPGMDHGSPPSAAPSTTKPADHQGMDHSGMNHDAMPGMRRAPAQAATRESRTPIPVLTDADRRAAFPPLEGHKIHDSALNSFFLLDQLEYQDADDGSALAWDASGWIGGDINRLWLRSEGERLNGKTEDAELQALFGHAIGPWWDLVAGVRQDFKPGSPQTWAAFGVQGLALYDFEAEVTAFLGENGQSALRLEGEYDILLTNRLILQPSAEINLYGRNDPARGIGSGLADSEVGLRLRYEIRREFAPYIGVTWKPLLRQHRRPGPRRGRGRRRGALRRRHPHVVLNAPLARR